MTRRAIDCWYLTGATASGKTSVGLELAAQLGAEIISLDSMAVYRGMDIGTAKPTLAQRRRVSHHLLDVVDPDQTFSLSNYLRLAHAAIHEVQTRGCQALFVGGTPLYLKSLLRGIFSGPPADLEFRRQIEAETAVVGCAALHQRLRQVDPLSAARLHPRDVRRIVRALEVYRATGKPISHLQLEFERAHPAEACKVFVLDWPRTELRRRIDRRVESMFALGLVDEMRSLRARYPALGRTALQAVGYREVFDLLEGRSDLAETVARIKARTWLFARRQETWFRGLSECRRVPRQDEDDFCETARRIVQMARDPHQAKGQG